MNRRAEINRNLVIFAICAPSAAVIWLIFHGVYTGLTESAKAVGYVDSGTQMGIALGYVAMIGGTLVFAGLAAWSGFRALALWLGQRRDAG